MLAKLAAVLIVGGCLLTASTAVAHHSFAAEFDAEKPITITGTLTKFEWVNPHGWLHVEVVGPDGKVESWAVEAGAPNALVRRGLRKTDFPAGAKIIVKGYRAKNGSNTINGQNVTFEDGRNFFLGAAETQGR